MYALRAELRLFEFFRAMHTFRICGGISSTTPGSHRELGEGFPLQVLIKIAESARNAMIETLDLYNTLTP